MRIVNIVSIALGLGLLLTSCVVGKKYERVALNEPAGYREQLPLTGDTIVMSWKKFYKDPLLVSIIDKALLKNNEVVVALKSIEQLELSYKQAKLSLMPTLEFNSTANRTYQSKNSLNGSLSQQFTGQNYLDDFTLNLGLSWEADIWGKAALQKRDAKANFFAQKENYMALKTRIISEVAQAYYNLLGLDEQLKIAMQNKDLMDNTLRITQLQYNSGMVSSLALSQIEAQKKTAELIIPLAKRNIAVQENALQILCGDFPDSVQRTGALDANQLEIAFQTGVPANLLSRRPDVKAAEYAVMSATAKTGLAEAAMYPTISINPQIGANSFKIDKLFDFPGSITKAIGGGILMPIFRKGQLRTDYKIAKIEQDKSVVQFKQTFLVAVGEVSDAMAQLKYADERLVLVEEKTLALHKATKDANLLYSNGMANYLEVITAQNNSLQNDLEAISIKQEKLNAAIMLYRSMGGGVD